jgi:flagellin
MAGEIANLSRQQVLSQSGTAMLAQANESTRSMLKLLGA